MRKAEVASLDDRCQAAEERARMWRVVELACKLQQLMPRQRQVIYDLIDEIECGIGTR
ncbi:MAG: hypothetical protein U1F76_10340 [Candidatus Competibacteraceae bacterium]